MKTNAFNQFAVEYDLWFDTHKFAYQSEAEAVRRFIPLDGKGIEIGAGTGRFSIPFEIKIGVEPSEEMAAIARSRGITIHNSKAESLPFPDEHFDFALFVTTLCFVDNPSLALQEAYRILKPQGKIIIGIIDRESDLGKKYESMKDKNKFYKSAKFYSTKDVIKILEETNFHQIKICQTIFSNPDEMKAKDTIKDGFGKGAFVVLSANKQ